jgi:hypothetical protein
MSSIIRWRSGVVFSSFIDFLSDGWEDPNRQTGKASHKERC